MICVFLVNWMKIGRIDVIRLLLRKNANKDITSDDDKTALEAASDKGKISKQHSYVFALTHQIGININSLQIIVGYYEIVDLLSATQKQQSK